MRILCWLLWFLLGCVLGSVFDSGCKLGFFGVWKRCEMAEFGVVWLKMASCFKLRVFVLVLSWLQPWPLF